MKKYLISLFVLFFLLGLHNQKAFAAEALTITKICAPTSCGASDSFSFTVNDSNGIIGSSFTLDSSNDFTKTFPNFQNSQMEIKQQSKNIYTIIENTPSGWNSPSIHCTPSDVFTQGTLSYADNSVTFDYTPNAMTPLAHITCTFTNTKEVAAKTNTETKSDSTDMTGADTSDAPSTGITNNIKPTSTPTRNPQKTKLNVQSVPGGVHLLSFNCYTVILGTCASGAITNLTLTNAGNIPHTSYQYPKTAIISGVTYTLDPTSFTGCNIAVSGWPTHNVCEVSVATGTTATISATYTVGPHATLNVESIPAGVHPIPSTSGYPVTAGTFGTTDWTMINLGAGMPTQSFEYPKYASIGGVSYTLNPNSLTGCNQGISGSASNTCSVSVALNATETVSATYSVTPPLPTCPASAQNLVKNSGFEVVHPNQPMFIYAGSYAFLESTGTPMNEVPDWTRMSQTRGPRATDNPGGYGILLAPFEGSREALLKSYSWGGAGFTISQGYKPDGVVGALSTSTVASSTYLISAEISTEFVMHQPSFEMWLRNSTTGADSPHIVQIVLPNQAMHWTHFAGAITANGQYDRVVISYNQGQADYPLNGDQWAQVDDVHVCKTSALSTGGLGKLTNLFGRIWGFFTSFLHRK